MVIKQVGPLSCAKVVASLYVIVGVCIGALISLASMAGGMVSDSPLAGWFGTAIGLGAIVVLPIFYGVLGFVMTLIGAWLYNIAAGIVGGIEIDVQ